MTPILAGNARLTRGPVTFIAGKDYQENGVTQWRIKKT
jgi:hypothetical protein